MATSETFLDPNGTLRAMFALNSNQCWGSGSAGSACFWASRIRIHQSEVRTRIPPFSHNCVERTEIMPAKSNFLTQNFGKKLNFLDWRQCACHVIRKKYEEIFYFIFWLFFASLKSVKKWVGSEVGSGSGVGSIGQRYRIQIRTKMSRIPNTGSDTNNQLIIFQDNWRSLQIRIRRRAHPGRGELPARRGRGVPVRLPAAPPPPRPPTRLPAQQHCPPQHSHLSLRVLQPTRARLLQEA